MAAILHAIQHAAALRRERIFRDRRHPLDLYNDEQMFKLYRFSRQGCLHLINRLSGRITHRTQRNHALPPSLQVFIALRYFATGSVMDCTSCIHGIHISTTSRTVRRVALALGELRDEVIKFPETMEEVRSAQIDFFNLAGMPNIVGAVDGTHVELHGAPLLEDEYIYTNRKGKHSINVQLICDAKYKITNVCARWPGSTHDSRVLRNSRIGERFADGELAGILVGDSGYPLQPWLITPLRDPQGNAERNYNRAHCRTRVTIEQLNGQLKNKFRCLMGQGIQMSAPRACDIIIACAVLFNIAKDLKEPEEIIEVEPDEVPHHPADQNQLTGIALRAELINNYFS